MTVPRYDAVLCDIDGVVRHWPAAEDLERAHGLPVGSVAAAAFGSARLQPAITGVITDEQWRDGVADYLAELCGSADRARAIVAAWSAQQARVDRDVVSLLERARRVATVVLVTNATTRLEHDLARQGLSDVADLVISSARVGVAKPDHRIYAIAAERAGASPAWCLFIDDTPDNVAAARELGMTGVHYRQVEDLRAALAPLWPVEPSAESGRLDAGTAPGDRPS